MSSFYENIKYNISDPLSCTVVNGLQHFTVKWFSRNDRFIWNFIPKVYHYVRNQHQLIYEMLKKDEHAFKIVMRKFKKVSLYLLILMVRLVFQVPKLPRFAIGEACFEFRWRSSFSLRSLHTIHLRLTFHQNSCSAVPLTDRVLVEKISFLCFVRTVSQQLAHLKEFLRCREAAFASLHLFHLPKNLVLRVNFAYWESASVQRPHII